MYRKKAADLRRAWRSSKSKLLAQIEDWVERSRFIHASSSYAYKRSLYGKCYERALRHVEEVARKLKE